MTAKIRRDSNRNLDSTWYNGSFVSINIVLIIDCERNPNSL